MTHLKIVNKIDYNTKNINLKIDFTFVSAVMFHVNWATSESRGFCIPLIGKSLLSTAINMLIIMLYVKSTAINMLVIMLYVKIYYT